MRTKSFRFVMAGMVLMSIYTSAIAQSSGFDPTRMDRSADACDDFFQFANGTWVENTENTDWSAKGMSMPFER